MVEPKAYTGTVQAVCSLPGLATQPHISQHFLLVCVLGFPSHRS